MLITASIIPIQFFGINFSLKNKIPATVDTNRIATLLIIKIVELSILGFRNA